MSTEQTTPNAGAQGPTPERIFQTLTAYQQSAALKAAVELDLFTSIAEGHDTAAALSQARGVSERGARILCDDMAVLGFLSKQDGRYALVEESTVFLDRRSPAYVGAMAGFLVGPQLLEAFANLTESVRRGTTTMSAQGSMSPEHPMWEEFARGMAAVMRPAAQQIADVTGAGATESCKVLDIAAGHGVFGITLAAANSRAEIHAVDWKNVLAFARRNAEEAGVAERFHEIPGDAFEVEFGTGYDLALVTNFFHHFDRATCVRLMRKIRPALAPGGRVVTLEFVPDEGRTSPPHAAVFPLVMLASTEAGDAYTFSEYDSMFREAGFGPSELHPGVPNAIIVTRA
ncbi:MAG TPA: class I SAM-dependent methyltransferase [Pyrinomonadaceae bacterium]|nr:class I SAM-dependent methyltransferase [Pyrinomonadaceae bacterium]